MSEFIANIPYSVIAMWPFCSDDKFRAALNHIQVNLHDDRASTAYATDGHRLLEVNFVQERGIVKDDDTVTDDTYASTTTTLYIPRHIAKDAVRAATKHTLIFRLDRETETYRLSIPGGDVNWHFPIAVEFQFPDVTQVIPILETAPDSFGPTGFNLEYLADFAAWIKRVRVSSKGAPIGATMLHGAGADGCGPTMWVACTNTLQPEITLAYYVLMPMRVDVLSGNVGKGG